MTLHCYILKLYLRTFRLERGIGSDSIVCSRVHSWLRRQERPLRFVEDSTPSNRMHSPAWRNIVWFDFQGSWPDEKWEFDCHTLAQDDSEQKKRKSLCWSGAKINGSNYLAVLCFKRIGCVRVCLLVANTKKKTEPFPKINVDFFSTVS